MNKGRGRQPLAPLRPLPSCFSVVICTARRVPLNVAWELWSRVATAVVGRLILSPTTLSVVSLYRAWKIYSEWEKSFLATLGTSSTTVAILGNLGSRLSREKKPKPQTFQFSSIFQPVRQFPRVFTFLTQANCLENQRQSTENQLSGNSAFHKKFLVKLLTIFELNLWLWVTTWFYEEIRPLLKPHGRISHKFSHQKAFHLLQPIWGNFFCDKKILFFASFKTEWKW